MWMIHIQEAENGYYVEANEMEDDLPGPTRRLIYRDFDSMFRGLEKLCGKKGEILKLVQESEDD